MSNTNTAENVTEIQSAKVNYNELEKVDAHSIFPDFFTPGERSLTRRKNRHPDCQGSNKYYIPTEKTLKRLLSWWMAPVQLQTFGLHGETGTGKTEMLLFVADHLNEPVYMVKCHGSLMPEDLEGSRVLMNGETPFNPGPAAKAYASGGLVIFDELDKVNRNTGAAIHGLLEGKPWPIEQIGKTLTKHSLCRIVATGNTTGEGGSEFYTSSQKLDDALRSRIGWYRTYYPQPAQELKIIQKQFPAIPYALAHKMVLVGNELRKLRVGDDGKGIDDPIGCIFSTRTLVNWAYHTMVFGKDAEWREALDFSMQGGVDSDSQEIVDAVLQRLLGADLDKPSGEVFASHAKK